MQAAQYNSMNITIQRLNPSHPRTGCFKSSDVMVTILDKFAKDEDFYSILAHYGKECLALEKAKNNEINRDAVGVLEILTLINTAKQNIFAIKNGSSLYIGGNKVFTAILNEEKIKLLNRQGENNYNNLHPAAEFSKEDVVLGEFIKSRMEPVM